MGFCAVHIMHFTTQKTLNSLTILTMNEVIYQWLGNILKQLHLSGINTKYFFKGVLCLKDKQERTVRVNGIQQKIDDKSNYHHHVLNRLVSQVSTEYNHLYGFFCSVLPCDFCFFAD